MKMKRKKSPFLFYLLIVLNIAACALAIYGLTGQWQVHEESRSDYSDLQQELLARSEEVAVEEEVKATASPAPLTVEEQEAQEEEEFEEVEDEGGMEDQEEAIFLINVKQPQFAAFGRTPSPEEGTPASSGEQASNFGELPSVAGAFPTPNPNISGGQSLPAQTEGEQVWEGIPAVPTPEPTIAQTPVPTIEPWMERAVQVDSARITMDFPHFQTLYEDIVAWIVQDGTKINYPVMQAEDNEYYLDHLYNGKSNKDGSIFLDCGNSAEFIDANNYIYGHNTKSGDMFGILAKYKSQEYYDANPSLTLLTPYSDFMIDFFACTMSLVEDESSWRIKQFQRKADFDAYIADLKEQSFFKSDVTPEWGDQFLVLCTCTNVAHGERYVVYGRMRPIRYGTAETIGLTKAEMDESPTISGKRIVGSLGAMQLYAQNDPLWKSLRYETKDSKKNRNFGDGGNGPTAVAMAIANMVPEDELTRLMGYARATDGFTFCTHSVNQYFCNNRHGQYSLKMPYEFTRYLPVAIASFTTGNNLWEEEARVKDKGGTNMTFLPYIAGIYGLDLETSVVLGNALDAFQQGGMTICLTSGPDSPFTNGSGSQYVVLAGMDSEYLYILDPYQKTNYRKTDSKRLLEVVAPNAVRVKLENIDYIGLNSYYILKPTQQPQAE